MAESNPYIQNLTVANPLREPLLRSVIESLQLPAGSQGLDAGCGIGLQALLLAEAVGSSGHVTGVDIAPELLVYGSKLAAQAGLTGRISFQQGEGTRLLFADDSFDWVWSADFIGYPVGELAPILRELARVVKPGGSIFILGWTSQQLLPGYPLLEARLNGTCSGYLPYLRGSNPANHFLRAPYWFRQAGLVEVKARTFTGEVQAPLDNGQRDALAALLAMLWGTRTEEVSPEDWNEYRRLCRPESPDFILNLPDYYGFFSYTLFSGKVAVG